ncbi:hypothetical protein [Gloeocapsopsis sp. IPPAS B-1203]|uniref:hypothetical protein n=1 Tax=Gloeocapsopsis sp. IPPAS B-1203 TaxID=2049454 RepID=UPI000C1A04CD|nr:hypothetical protein [Gloeocapsopsis sp. IPPAS B-1203]PIG92388.1 hypothetical protein CSQ79_16220 [Gloeocapsopsis sp. IPPAS B-1203]
MSHFIPTLILTLQPALKLVYFVIAWAVVVLFLLTIWRTVHDTFTQAKQMHRIPCSGCQFFTGSYQLKCTVRPDSALTEEAIDCSDFYPKR